MTTINVELRHAPTTPLNLQFGVIYAPRVTTQPLVGFDAVDAGPGWYHVRGYDANGVSTVLYQGDLYSTYWRLASHLQMDVAP